MNADEVISEYYFRNNGNAKELEASQLSFRLHILTSLSRNRDVETPSYHVIIRFSPCGDPDAFLGMTNAGYKAA